MTPIDHSSQAMLYQIISAIWLAIRGVTQWLLSKDFISMFLNYRHGDLKKKKNNYEEEDLPAGALSYFYFTTSFNSLGSLKEPLSAFTSPVE